MQILKSLHAGVLHKTFSHEGKHHFALTTLWGFRLGDASPVLEQDLWQAIGEVFGTNQLFDAANPKPNGEVLVHGSFFAPGAQPVGAGKVSVSLGTVSKELVVFGDRYWVKGLGAAIGVRDPEPMTEMPIIYANAFGGEGFERNPIGKGMTEVDGDDGPRHPLPNVEYANALIGAPGDRPDPAGLGALDITWQPRAGRSGTYDQKYIDERMPGLPDDFDWRFFNDAPPDQWSEGFFTGDEPFEIVNMHPEHAQMTGNLPGVCGRGFVTHQVGEEREFKEIPLRLDTVWFFPGDDLGVVLHRGTLAVSDDQAGDVVELLVAHENTADPRRDPDHYEDQLRKRTDPEEGFKYLLNSTPLIPVGTRCAFQQMQEQSPIEGLGLENSAAFSKNKEVEALEQVDQQVGDIRGAVAELDGVKEEDLQRMEVYKSPPAQASPEADKIKEIMNKVLPGLIDDPKNIDISQLDMKAMDELREYTDQLAAEKQREAEATLHDELQKLKDSAENPDARAEVERLEQTIAEERARKPLLPRVDIEAQLADVEATYEKEFAPRLVELRAQGVSEDDLAKMKLDLGPAREGILEAAGKMVDGYRIGAHFVSGSRSPHEGREAEIADALLAARASGRTTAGGDYAFVDLSGQDLSGADLSGAFLEYADLSGANLSGAKLDKAILAHANLSNADLSNASLTEANLGATRLVETNFADADLTGATLGLAQIVRTRFHRCKMLDKPDMFLDAEFEGADFSGADLHGGIFIKSGLGGCLFVGADLSGASLVECALNDSDFSQATLAGTNFVLAQAQGAKFVGAAMTNARFVGGCELAGADFSDAQAPESNFRDCNLEGAKFAGAVLNKSDFGGSNLRDAGFERVLAIQAQFNGADLRNATLESMNLMEGSMHKARISGARFVNGNFYGVNFLGATVGETDFSGAYLEQTIFKDWRPS